MHARIPSPSHSWQLAISLLVFYRAKLLVFSHATGSIALQDKVHADGTCKASLMHRKVTRSPVGLPMHPLRRGTSHNVDSEMLEYLSKHGAGDE